MTKLKTLKDIEDELTTKIIFPDDLRNLAKEWIKKSEKDLKEFKKIKKECDDTIKEGKAWGSLGTEATGILYGKEVEYYIAQIIGRINWIKHFFNLEDK